MDSDAENLSILMQSEKKATKKTRGRQQRRKKIANLEDEVKKILSEEEDDEDVAKPGEKKTIEQTTESPRVVSPSSHNSVHEVQPQTPCNVSLLQDSATPRRSTRKSIKPAQDYDEIVGKRHLRSAAKEDVDKDQEEPEEPQPKWTPAKVGRVSQKRGRRNRKTVGVGGEKRETKKGQQSAANDDSEKENITKLHIEDKVNHEVEGKKKAQVHDVKEGQLIEFSNSPTVDKELAPAISEPEYLETANDREKANEVETEVINDQETAKVCSEKLDEIEIELYKIKGESLEAPTEAYVEAVILDATQEFGEKELVATSAPQMAIDDKEKQIMEVSSQIPENVEVPVRKGENFGIYLKSNDLNISDLGLNPLQADDSIEEQVDNISTKQEPLEVTSASPNLKQDMKESVGKESSSEVLSVNNDTFDRSDDCIEVTGSSEEPLHDFAMQTLQISDDDEEDVPPPTKLPRIVVTDDQKVIHNLLSTPRPMQVSGTPKKRATPYRFSTPYKRKEAFNFTAITSKNETKTDEDYQKIEDKTKIADETTAAEQQSVTVMLTTMEPKEIILRSIRKRSLSVCIDGGSDRRRIKPLRNVTFHSPANQTAVIEEFDLLVSKKDANTNKTGEDPKDNYVTKRRKRSMSFDESMCRKMSRLPRPTATAPRNLTPNKQRQQTPTKAVPRRTKLPNFAAIHQKQFDKMENLVEHVQRKNERAKGLTSSGSKLMSSASAQKEIRNQKQRLAAGSSEKPKAVKKIVLDVHKSSTDANNIAEKSHSEEDAKEKLMLNKLPIPRSILKQRPEENPNEKLTTNKVTKTATIKPMFSVIADIPKKMLQKSTTAKKPAIVKSINQLKKPAFNLSTSINTTATITGGAAASTTTANKGFLAFGSAMPYKNAGGDANITVVSSSTSLENKVFERRQRHMDMFKGRTAGGARGGTVDADGSVQNFGQIIRGVRSNRRFELQMQHRRNLENN